MKSEPPADRGALFVFRHVGPAIRLVRERTGLTQAALARRASLGKSQLSKYEAGKELPRLESLARAVDSLETDALTVFYWANKLARDVSEEDLRTELLQAYCARSGESDPFKRVLADILDLYRLHIDVESRG